MKNFVIACLMAMTIAGCAGCSTVPTTPTPTRPPDDTILSVIGIFECGKLKGFAVTTKSGKIAAVQDDDKDDLLAIAKTLPPDSADAINVRDNCPPTETTGFHPPR